MKFCSTTAPILVFCILFATCNEQQKYSNEKRIVTTQERDTTLESIIKKFSLFYNPDSIVDENSLIFFCSRTFDTSSLIVLKKSHGRINGAYYEILPTYHKYVNDFADPENNLLFFEGYSFIIDSLTWTSVHEAARLLLSEKDRFNKGGHYVDGKAFALYHNFENCAGNSSDEFVFEKFDKFLKQSFLEKIIKARQPIMRKIK